MYQPKTVGIDVHWFLAYEWKSICQSSPGYLSVHCKPERAGRLLWDYSFDRLKHLLTIWLIVFTNPFPLKRLSKPVSIFNFQMKSVGCRVLRIFHWVLWGSTSFSSSTWSHPEWSRISPQERVLTFLGRILEFYVSRERSHKRGVWVLKDWVAASLLVSQLS